MGFRSGVHAAGGQGALAHRRKELQEDALRETLEAAQINEVQRLAQEYSPACMRELKRIATSHRKDEPVLDGARLAAIRIIIETAYGKPNSRGPSDGGMRTKVGSGRSVVVNIRQYGVGISKQVKTQAIEAQVLPEIADAEIETDL